MDHIEELARALSRFPGIGPRQGKRFVYYLLAAPADERKKLAELIASLGKDVKQCPDCMRYFNGTSANICNYCTDKTRDNTLLMLVEKIRTFAVEPPGHTRQILCTVVYSLSGKGAIREKIKNSGETFTERFERIGSRTGNKRGRAYDEPRALSTRALPTI